ncbi:MAG TPA: hypothetical protein ENJ57_02145 [Rhizobiales bacterium]|nr:hypothetical protein [Hyphomicrobiales bacterium]
MKLHCKTVLVCLLGAFMLLGQVLVKDTQGVALNSTAEAGTIIMELGDDPLGDDAACPLPAQTGALIPAELMQEVSIPPEEISGSECRTARFFPDTRAPPAI